MPHLYAWEKQRPRLQRAMSDSGGNGNGDHDNDEDTDESIRSRTGVRVCYHKHLQSFHGHHLASEVWRFP